MAGNPLILSNIRSKYQSFNVAFKKVADFFLSRHGDPQYIKISDVASGSGVSKATVSRFIKELGFSSFKSFQIEMAKNGFETSGKLDDHSYIGYDQVSRDDSAREVCQKVFGSNIKSLQEMMLLLDPAVAQKIADRIIKAEHVVIFAMGRSSLPANGFRMRLARLGIRCVTLTDPHEMVMHSTLMTPRDLAIGISSFGRSASVIRNMKTARDNGAWVIGITSCRDTPIETAADQMLYTSASDDLFCSSEPSCTTNTNFVLLDCIYMLVTNRIPKETLGNFPKGAAALEAERY